MENPQVKYASSFRSNMHLCPPPPPLCASCSDTEMGKSLTQEHPRAQSKKIPLTSQPALAATHGGITPSVISPDTWPSALHGGGGWGCTGGHSTAADSRQTFQIFIRNHLCLPYLLISPPFRCLVSVWTCLYRLWGARLPNTPFAWGIGRQINTSCSLTFKFFGSASIWLANHILASHFFFCFLPNHGYLPPPLSVEGAEGRKGIGQVFTVSF